MIYIVEDDKNVRDGFVMLLRSEGFISKAYDKAEDFLKEFKPAVDDLLILDMHLPGMNGCALLDKMEKRGIHFPFIIITGFDEPVNRSCAKKYGALAYLRKPVDSTALIDLIKFNLDIKKSFNTNNSFHNQRSSI